MGWAESDWYLAKFDVRFVFKIIARVTAIHSSFQIIIQIKKALRMVDFKKLDMGELGRHLFAKILKATASDGTFQEIYEECKAKNQPYEDESFPPTEFSLISD